MAIKALGIGLPAAKHNISRVNYAAIGGAPRRLNADDSVLCLAAFLNAEAASGPRTGKLTDALS